jgi:hypothetical protein
MQPLMDRCSIPSLFPAMIQQACELPKATDAAKVERIKKLSV